MWTVRGAELSKYDFTTSKYFYEELRKLSVHEDVSINEFIEYLMRIGLKGKPEKFDEIYYIYSRVLRYDIGNERRCFIDLPSDLADIVEYCACRYNVPKTKILRTLIVAGLDRYVLDSI